MLPAPVVSSVEALSPDGEEEFVNARRYSGKGFGRRLGASDCILSIL